MYTRAILVVFGISIVVQVILAQRGPAPPIGICEDDCDCGDDGRCNMVTYKCEPGENRCPVLSTTRRPRRSTTIEPPDINVFNGRRFFFVNSAPHHCSAMQVLSVIMLACLIAMPRVFD